MNETRFTANYVLDFNQSHDEFNPDEIIYGTVTGVDLIDVITRASDRDPNNEPKGVCREELITDEDGFSYWRSVSTIDPFDLTERWL